MSHNSYWLMNYFVFYAASIAKWKQIIQLLSLMEENAIKHLNIHCTSTIVADDDDNERRVIITTTISTSSSPSSLSSSSASTTEIQLSTLTSATTLETSSDSPTSTSLVATPSSRPSPTELTAPTAGQYRDKRSEPRIKYQGVLTQALGV